MSPKINERFGHPHWEHLTQDEKIEWLTKKIDELVALDSPSEQEDDLLTRCFAELDRLTASDAVTDKHAEEQLQKIISIASIPSSPLAFCRKLRPALRLTALALIVLSMLGMMIPPASPHGLDVPQDYQSDYVARNYTIDDVRIDAIDYGAYTILPFDQKESRAPNEPYTATYWSLEEYLANEDFDIIYPTAMPEKHRIKYIHVDYRDEEHWEVSFSFYGQLICRYSVIREPYPHANLYRNLATDSYTVDDRTFYIREGRKNHLNEYYMADYTTDTLHYSVKTKNREIIDILLKATETGTP